VTPDTAPDTATKALGLLNKFNLNTNAMINFALEADSALITWEWNKNKLADKIN
jgi:hypothetical protein